MPKNENTTLSNLKIISAGAGSGKTYRLTKEMVQFLQEGIRPGGIIATTFTQKAAAELQERVRSRLLQLGLIREAEEISNALIGTVHGIGVKLLKRFAFEAGVSPQVDILADSDQQELFNKSLSMVLHEKEVRKMETLSERLSLTKGDRYDWRREVKAIADTARANNFSTAQLEESKQRSFQSFQELLASPAEDENTNWHAQCLEMLATTIEQLEQSSDQTKVTGNATNDLRYFHKKLSVGNYLNWHEWAKLMKTKVGAKSREIFEPLRELVARHDEQAGFRQDVRDFIYGLFEIAMAAIEEYDAYKKQRGLIDYIDMEVAVCHLLDQPGVRNVLASELDLLMVDEFQDTSPIQLELFLKLTALADQAVWVGDPKQSIYGFRGAEPALMQAVIEATGGIRPENIQPYSWRSRADLVCAANAIFTQTFSGIPAEQVALEPKRNAVADASTVNQEDEPLEMEEALIHWHFEFDGEGRPPGRPWLENGIARAVRRFLERAPLVQDKTSKRYRSVNPGDVAILCRTNSDCQRMAEALAAAGLKVAIARKGLLQTSEVQLLLACLKYILNADDSLSVAEILILSRQTDVKGLVEDRLEYLERSVSGQPPEPWGNAHPLIARIDRLRALMVDQSSSELLSYLLEVLGLRRIVMGWGKAEQRLANIEAVRSLALQYEEDCNRIHAAASLGGFMLWLSELEEKQEDQQGSSEEPDAVNVLTYHRSKGLEWPVVVCHGLDARLRERVFGLSVVSDFAAFDIHRVLAHRWLRYWTNPYGDQIRKTRLHERLQESAVYAQALQEAREEEARLLYVGITRARDYLIFPTAHRPSLWLNRVCMDGEEDIPALSITEDSAPWKWQDRTLPMKKELFHFSRDFPDLTSSEQQVRTWASSPGEETYQSYLIDLHREPYAQHIESRVIRHLPLPARLQLEDDQANRYDVAKAYKAFLTGDAATLPAKERLHSEAIILRRFGQHEYVQEGHMVDAANAYHSFLEDNFKPLTVFRKYPLRFHYQGRQFQTVIDWVGIEKNRVVFVQHSGFNGQEKQMESHLQTLKDWIFFAGTALKKVLGCSTANCFIHFVMFGHVMEVDTRQAALFL